jgi:hypothetical protein
MNVHGHEAQWASGVRLPDGHNQQASSFSLAKHYPQFYPQFLVETFNNLQRRGGTSKLLQVRVILLIRACRLPLAFSRSQKSAYPI